MGFYEMITMSTYVNITIQLNQLLYKWLNLIIQFYFY